MRRHPPQPSGSAPPRFQAPLGPVFGKRAIRRRITIVSGFILVLSALGLLVSLSSVVEDRARSATTSATVVGGETVESGGRYSTSTICRDATVTFTVDGRDYVRTSPVDRCPADGGPDRVDVLYDPDDPENFITEDNDEFAYVAVGLFAVMGLASLGGLLSQLYLRIWRPLIDERADATSMYRTASSSDVGAPSAAEDAGRLGALPAGVTAYRVRREETPRPGSERARRGVTAAAVVAALGTLALGARPVAALVVLVIAVGLVLLAGLPRRRWVRGVLLVLLVTWGLAGVGAATDGGAELLTWLCGLVAGFVLAAPMRSRRALRRRRRTAVGAPGAAWEPRGGRDVGTLVTWRDHAYEYEALDPDLDLVVGAVGRLGEPGHDYVSVYRGVGRLDVFVVPRRAVTRLVCADRRQGRAWLGTGASPVEHDSAIRAWLDGGAASEVVTGGPVRTFPRSSRPRPLRATD